MENPELDIQQFFGHMEYIWDIHGEVIDIIHGSSDTGHVPPNSWVMRCTALNAGPLPMDGPYQTTCSKFQLLELRKETIESHRNWEYIP